MTITALSAGSLVDAPAHAAAPPALPPEVITGSASAITQASATLSGTIDTHGDATTYELDLGADTSYGTRIFGEVRFKEGPETLTVSLQDLAAGITYHFRLTATDAFGTAYGADETFTTPSLSELAAPVAPPLVPTPLIGSPSSASTAKSSAGARSVRRRSKSRPKKSVRKRRNRPARSRRSTRARHVQSVRRRK